MQSRRAVRTGRVAMAIAVAALGATTACGRSSNTPTGTDGTTTTPSSAASSSAAKGDFGTLKGICGPGDAKGATAKGVTDTEIRVGTTADPGAAAVPGLEQEFFDTADAFSKWCNDAGGINGRKIVVDKWDAKLFNVGQAMTNACQKDFMLVGNGNAADAAGVKPREQCKLGDIFAYTVSPEAATAKYKVNAVPYNPNEYSYGPLRLLLEAYPDSKTKGVGIGSSTIASLIPVGKRINESLEQNNIKVTALQSQPPIVDNFRPYMEQLKGAGTVGLDQIVGQDYTPLVQAMKNVGWQPQWLLLSVQYYLDKTVQSAQSLGTIPDSYVGFSHLAFEMDNQKYPVLGQIKDILKASIKEPRFTDFTASSFSAWALWAKSATACGSNLTSECVLQKAGAEKEWTAGGLYAPVDTDPNNQHIGKCWLNIKLTTSGWVYDEKVTKPTDGPYNCDPKNVTKTQSYQ
jgi:ABC-type branched-subunit amino acid transport system substrate-binding protein